MISQTRGNGVRHTSLEKKTPSLALGNVSSLSLNPCPKSQYESTSFSSVDLGMPWASHDLVSIKI
jgi:hypothetical protein